jgi:hypothetical protein
VYCGTDKVGHLLQQGHEYFEVFARAEARGATNGREDPGATASAALAEAVRVGVGQEHGFYGEALVGVYSNADLAANYAGLKLYLNLTRPVRVGGGLLRPPLLVKFDGRWVPNADAIPRINRTSGSSAEQRRADAFLRPFISEHFNESINPSRYKEPTRHTIRTLWQQRSAAWVAFYHSTPQRESQRLHQFATWYGESYGHGGFDGLVTACDTCFRGTSPPVHLPVAVMGRAPVASPVAPISKLAR